VHAAREAVGGCESHPLHGSEISCPLSAAARSRAARTGLVRRASHAVWEQQANADAVHEIRTAHRTLWPHERGAVSQSFIPARRVTLSSIRVLAYRPQPKREKKCRTYARNGTEDGRGPVCHLRIPKRMSTNPITPSGQLIMT